MPGVLKHFRAQAIDVSSLLTRLRLADDLADREEVRISLATLQAFWEEAERVTGDTLFVLHIAAAVPRGFYGAPEFVGRHAPTLKDALERFVRYQAFLHDLPSMTFHERRGGAGAVEHEVLGEPNAIGRHGNEFVVAALVRYCEELVGEPVVPNRVWFAHAAPGPADALVRHFGTRVDFGQGSNGILVDGEALARPVPGADLALLPVLDELAARGLPARGEERPLWRVRARIRAHMADASLSLDVIARDVHLSPRTLQRRLQEANTSFAALVDDVRRETAVDLLGDRSLGVGDIGFLVGYEQPRAFLRAFKRWMGLTPREYRLQTERRHRGS